VVSPGPGRSVRPPAHLADHGPDSSVAADNNQVLCLWTSKLMRGVELPAPHVDVTRDRMAGYPGRRLPAGTRTCATGGQARPAGNDSGATLLCRS